MASITFHQVGRNVHSQLFLLDVVPQIGLGDRKKETRMTGRIESRLAELNIKLPEPPAPVASYVPYVVSGKLVFISGQVTMADDGLKFVGAVGKELSLEDGKAAARLCAINVLAQL